MVHAFRATLEALLVMPFALIRAVAPHMKKLRTGHISLLSSATPLAPSPNSSGYIAARAGASNLPKSVSLELAEHNVQINAMLSQFLHSDLYYPRDLFENNLEVSDKRVPKSALSKHFGVLREAGLIRSTRIGKEMHNVLREEVVKERFDDLVTAIINAHKEQELFQRAKPGRGR